jgi:hypothetical protein
MNAKKLKIDKKKNKGVETKGPQSEEEIQK